ncbi:MAG: hypothetical protein ACKPAD_16000, partial [Bacteroidota bacterium]
MKKIYTSSFFRLIAILVACPGLALGQTTIYQSGFEAGDPAIVAQGSSGSHVVNYTTGPITAAVSGRSSFGSGTGSVGSFMTGLVNFTAGKYYQIEATVRKNSSCTGKLQMYKNLTQTHAAMIASTGGDIILNPAANNISGINPIVIRGTFYASVT